MEIKNVENLDSKGQDFIMNPIWKLFVLQKSISESKYSGFGGKDSNPNSDISYNTDFSLFCFNWLFAAKFLILLQNHL